MVNNKIDREDYNYFVRLFGEKPISFLPCPIKNGKINPTTTRFFSKGGKTIDVFHIKPIYYETLDNTWRPLDEVCSGFGNRWINLKEDWDKKMNPRYLRWLLNRMNLIRGSVNFPVPGGSFMPIREGKEIFFTTSTFYPDPHPESTSVDGVVDAASYGTGSGVTWTTLVGDAGGSASDSAVAMSFFYTLSDNVSNRFRNLSRAIFLFDTSALPDGDVIDSATISNYGRYKQDTLSASPTLNIYSSNPASNTALVAGDFDSLGTTAFSDSAIAYGDWTNTGYNDFVLNASGLAAISKTGVSKYGGRNANYDVADSAPSWSSVKESQVDSETADSSGTSKDPKLVVVHSTPVVGPANLKTLDTVAKANVKTINTVPIASVKTWDTIE
jgi:hypothetical protein